MQVTQLARRAWAGQGFIGALTAASLVAAAMFVAVMLTAGPRPSPLLTEPIRLACPGGTNSGQVDHFGDDPGERDPREVALRYARHMPADSVFQEDGLELREERGADLARVTWLDDAGRVQARMTFVRATGGGWLIDTIANC
jgi:hypothetical protein